MWSGVFWSPPPSPVDSLTTRLLGRRRCLEFSAIDRRVFVVDVNSSSARPCSSLTRRPRPKPAAVRLYSINEPDGRTDGQTDTVLGTVLVSTVQQTSRSCPIDQPADPIPCGPLLSRRAARPKRLIYTNG